MKTDEKPKLRFGINHRGASKPSLAKQKDLISGEKPVTQRPDKKKREKQNKR